MGSLGSVRGAFSNGRPYRDQEGWPDSRRVTDVDGREPQALRPQQVAIATSVGLIQKVSVIDHFVHYRIRSQQAIPCQSSLVWAMMSVSNMAECQRAFAIAAVAAPRGVRGANSVRASSVKITGAIPCHDPAAGKWLRPGERISNASRPPILPTPSAPIAQILLCSKHGAEARADHRFRLRPRPWLALYYRGAGRTHWPRSDGGYGQFRESIRCSNSNAPSRPKR